MKTRIKVKAINTITREVIKTKSIVEMERTLGISRILISEMLDTNLPCQDYIFSTDSELIIYNPPSKSNLAMKVYALNTLTNEIIIFNNKTNLKMTFGIGGETLNHAINNEIVIRDYKFYDYDIRNKMNNEIDKHFNECQKNIKKVIEENIKSKKTIKHSNGLIFSLDQISNQTKKTKEELIDIIKHNFKDDKDFEAITIITDYNMNVQALAKLQEVI